MSLLATHVSLIFDLFFYSLNISLESKVAMYLLISIVLHRSPKSVFVQACSLMPSGSFMLMVESPR